MAGPIGSTGTSLFRDHFGLQLGDAEYNADLRPPHSYEIYDKMRRADATIAGALKAISLPLLGATWSVEPGGDTPADIAAAEFVGEALLGAPEPWVDRLRNILLFLPYGSMPFETVWETRPWRGMPKWWLRSLSPRMPATITRWLVDELGELTGVVQEQYTSGGTGPDVTIEADDLVVFANDREGADWRGVSILRAAYQSWDFKQRLMLIEAMGIERRNHGIDIATLKGEVAPGSAEETAAKNAVRSVHAHEKMYLIEYEKPDGTGFAYRCQGIDGTVIPAGEAIERHDRWMLRAMVAEALAIGSGDVGSFALSRDKSSLFLQGLTAWGGIITETLNRVLVPRMVAPNFPGTPATPRLVHSRLDTRDLTAVATALNQLAGGQPVITIDEGVENDARDLLEIKRLEPTQRVFEGRKSAQLGRRSGREILPEVMQAIDEAEERGVDVTLARNAAALMARPPRGGEWHMDLAKIERTLDAGADQVAASASIYQAQLAESIVRQVEEAERAGKLADLDPLAFALPDDAETVAEIAAALKAIAQRGYDEARAEVKRQGVALALQPKRFAIDAGPGDDAFFTARAKAYLAVVAQRLLAVGSATALDSLAAGGAAAEGLLSVLTGVGDHFLTVEAGKVTTKALSVGRQTAQREIQAEPEFQGHAEYTALLDGATCENCGAVDAEELRYEVGSPLYQQRYPPYKDCLGYPRCRCQMVLVPDSEITRTG